MFFDPKVLMQELKNYVMEVRFTKADGSMRVMKCTLRPDVLPATNESSQHTSPQLLLEDNNPLFTVWDIQANAWRSFHLNTVQSIQALDVV